MPQVMRYRDCRQLDWRSRVLRQLPFGRYEGALLGLALIPALVVIPAVSC